MSEVYENGNYVWDFTLSIEFCEDHKVIIESFKGISKKWAFQLEESEDKGYVHWQGRMSLIKPKRSAALVNKVCKGTVLDKAHFSLTSKENKDNFDYAEKVDTRIEGPWTYKDKEFFVPRHLQGIIDKLYPFQKDIMDDCLTPDMFGRLCNMVICKKGGGGKSTIASLCNIYHNMLDLPPCNDFKEIIQACCDMCYKETRDPKGVFFDLPRAMPQGQLCGIFAGMEQIKKGKLFDFRYKYKEWWIHSPSVWMFTNSVPNLNMLSKDRWQLWQIDENHCLVPYVPDDTKESADLAKLAES